MSHQIIKQWIEIPLKFTIPVPLENPEFQPLSVPQVIPFEINKEILQCQQKPKIR